MRTFAMLLVLVAVAASQPYHWLSVIVTAIAHILGR